MKQVTKACLIVLNRLQRAVVDMPLRRLRRQRVARQLGRSDCVVRRCWDQWMREISITRRPGLECPRQISRQEERHIIRNACVQPTASDRPPSRHK
ncbi:transposable element Tcb2 transposase [Trichonephila clavipes]|uniref:Transposable element Tcb2 transposase n=1 Tax=Trichonephila clavipes TaxID=2585209 RepID=A0A8X7BDB2_TRICX|nr:transposable element Tcb2 transposase [Trichonephila clavipes]